MNLDDLKARTVSVMGRLVESAPESIDEGLRVVQQATRLIEAVGVKRTEVRHLHVEESPHLSPA